MSAASEELRRLRTTPRDPRRDQEASRGCADDTPPAAASARERARFGRLASSNVRRTSIRCWRSALTRMAPAAIRTPAMTGRMRGMTYRPMSTSLEPSSGASSSCSGVWARHRPGWRASSVWSSGSGSAIGLWSTSEGASLRWWARVEEHHDTVSFAKTSSDSLRSSEIRSIRPLAQAASLFGGLGDRHPQAVGLCTVNTGFFARRTVSGRGEPGPWRPFGWQCGPDRRRGTTLPCGCSDGAGHQLQELGERGRAAAARLAVRPVHLCQARDGFVRRDSRRSTPSGCTADAAR